MIRHVPAGKNLYTYYKLILIKDFLKLRGKVNGVPVRFWELSFEIFNQTLFKFFFSVYVCVDSQIEIKS